jgi:uncharacterized protein involved in exopolysaccharide biosynthesis
MTDKLPDPAPAARPEPDFSLLSVGAIVLRRRKLVFALGMAGGLLGLTAGLTSTRVFVATAMIIPQSAGGSGASSGLALAASQFGISVPGGGNAWSPQLYVELFRSRTLLEPIALDTIVVAEEGGRRMSVMDLLKIEGPSPDQRLDLAVRALRTKVSANPVQTLAAVRLEVKTTWPSVSLAVAERLVSGINRFNVETRKSQAVAERQFVEAQTIEAERSLREAEDRLQAFMQRNRAISPASEVGFAHDRLQREVALRQQAYTSLVLSRDEARIREVRDTPTITVLESPRLPLIGESRRSVIRAVMGGIAGGVLGLMIALIAHATSRARREPDPDSREFFRLLEEATPRWLCRAGR